MDMVLSEKFHPMIKNPMFPMKVAVKWGNPYFQSNPNRLFLGKIRVDRYQIPILDVVSSTCLMNKSRSVTMFHEYTLVNVYSLRIGKWPSRNS